MLTEVEAQQIAERFLAAKYPGAKIVFSGHQLITKDNIQMYQLGGKITMRSRGAVDRIVIPTTANQYDFTIEIQAQQGQIVNYEFR